MKTIYLVACGKTKRPHCAAAKDLYISPLFKKSSDYAVSHSDCWYILSAKHHLLAPEKEIDPYELTLKTMSNKERSVWAEVVMKALREVVQVDDTVVFLAGSDYREKLEDKLRNMGCRVTIPLKGLTIGRALHWLNVQLGLKPAKGPASIQQEPRIVGSQELLMDVDRFYAILLELEQEVGGKRILNACNGNMNWPNAGVYFFFEDGECRRVNQTVPRVVRVGTHALIEKSKTTLWTRLKQHKGSGDGTGNHRGSIFRLHVGTALIEKQGNHASYPSWGRGGSAKKDITDRERQMECQVSEHIGRMPFLWLAADTLELRTSIERNSIGLLSNRENPVDPPGPCWLGNSSTRPAIRHTGLWNVKHVTENCDPSFLDDLEDLVSKQSP